MLVGCSQLTTTDTSTCAPSARLSLAGLDPAHELIQQPIAGAGGESRITH